MIFTTYASNPRAHQISGDRRAASLIFISHALHAFVAIYASYLEAKGEYIDGPVKLLWAVPLLILPRRLIFDSGLPKWLTALFFLTIVTGLVRGGVGLADEYFAKYYFGDALKLISAWILFFCTVNLAINQGENFWRRLLWIILFMSAIDAVATIYLSSTRPFKIHTTTYFCGLAVLAFQRSAARISNAAALPLVILFCAAALTSGKRASLVFLLTISMLWLLTITLRPRRLSVIVLAFLIGILAAYAFLPAMIATAEGIFNLTGSPTVKGFVELLASVGSEGVGGDSSLDARIMEAKNILHYFEASPHDYLFGAGFGASIPMIYDTHVYAPDGTMHHAHISVAVYFLRHGAIGVLLLYSLFFIWAILIIDRLTIARRGLFSLNRVYFSLGCFLFVFSASFKSQVLYDSSAIFLPAGLTALGRQLRQAEKDD